MSPESDSATKVAPKLPPEAVTLRAPPQPVTRLNRRTLIVLAGALAAVVLLATVWSLGPSQRRDADTADRYNVDRVSRTEALNRLPEDYSALLQSTASPEVPELGPPLPGDLGAPILRAEQEAQGYGAAGVDPAEDERLARLKEAEEAARSGVFFRTSGATVDVASSEASASIGLRLLDSAMQRPLGDEGITNGPTPASVERSTTGNTGELRPPGSPYQVMAGTVIAAALVTGIQSDLPGEVIATVTEPVYDTATGRHLLIPQGARLMGRYGSDIGYAQSRVRVTWHRVIMPDTSSLQLDDLMGTDPGGYAGLQDEVDHHWGRLLGGAVLSTVLGMGAELAAPDHRIDGNRILVAGRDSAQEAINQAGQEITRRNLDRQPTLTLRPGLPVRVIVSRDLVLRSYQPLFALRESSP